MVTIRASCETCGNIELTTTDVRVWVCNNDNRGEYSFRCPYCATTVVKGAEPRSINLLVASDVQRGTFTLPAEMSETKNGRRISHHDLVEFQAKLHDTAAWDEALDALLNG